MKQWLRRISGAIGIALTWAAAWFVAGIVLARVPGFYSDLPFALLFGPLGFATAILFSGILIASERQCPFDRLSLPRFAAWGAASGLLLSGIIVATAPLRRMSPWSEFLVFGPPLILSSAASAAASLALARRVQLWRKLLLQLTADVPTNAKL